MLRIIAGKYGSRKIEQPDSDSTRPTTDKVREAVFSSIQFEVENAIILDLFAGSGAWSFEALSRGAMKAFAIDKNSKAIAIIKENAKNLNCNNVVIEKNDAINFLQTNKGKEFDFIFMDAPYALKEVVNNALELIQNNKYLKSFGKIILETDDLDKITLPKNLIISKFKKYGITYVATITWIK